MTMTNKIYLGNAFSLQMVSGEEVTVNVKTVEAAEVANTEFTSCIGHVDTATVVSSLLGGKEVEPNRVNVTLEPGDILYVAQVTGGRLPEGATTLPEGIEIVFKRVEILE